MNPVCKLTENVRLDELVQCKEHPMHARERYKQALKEGFVEAELLKIVIIGGAGVGKTHLLHCLFNEPPPTIRCSTSICERAVDTIVVDTNKHKSFTRLNRKELLSVMASFTNTMSQTTNLQSSDIHSTNETTETPALQPKCDVKLNDEHLLDTNGLHSISNDIALSETGVDLIAEIAKDGPSSKPVIKIGWVYFIDSGGQPQFHQLLPAFITNADIFIFVLRLCDNLNDIPTPEYYDSTGMCHTMKFSSNLPTNAAILKGCVTAMVGTKAQLLIVGTHRDKLHHEKADAREQSRCGDTKYCQNDEKKAAMVMDHFNDDTIQQKGKEIKEYLNALNIRNYLVNNQDPNQLIFPINAKDPDAQDKEVISNIREHVLSKFECCKESKDIHRIPIRWLMFHEEIKELSDKKKSEILTLAECLEVAKKLNIFEPVDVKDALNFFAESNLLLYYSALPDVVFIKPQSLVNVVSGIVTWISYYKFRGVTENIFQDAVTHGILSVNLLEKLMKHSDHLNPDIPEEKKEYDLLLPLSNAWKHCSGERNLFHLFIDRKIACRFGEDKYFMPSILKYLEEKDINKELIDDTIVPAILCPEGKECFKYGTFSFLITTLISSTSDWKIAPNEEKQPLCAYSNCIMLQYDDVVIVTLVDYVSYIEVHVNSTLDLVKKLGSRIKQSIINCLAQMEEYITFHFVCPCKMVKTKHMAVYKEYLKIATCTKKCQQIFQLSEVGIHAELWFHQNIMGKNL